MSQLHSVEDVAKFITAGKATLTLKSKKTGSHFTYKVCKPVDKETGKVNHDASVCFVKLLCGPENTTDYQFLGTVFTKSKTFKVSEKSRISAASPGSRAFDWTVQKVLCEGVLPETVEVYHSGNCGRCGRKLTTPESVTRGIGPECFSKL